MILESGSAWFLHPQLAADTASIGDLPLSRVLIVTDANYPWLILAPRRAGAIEIIDLEQGEQATLMQEIARAAHALKAVTRCDKLNIATLGNVVPQLHVHIIARRRDDAAWPAPVWGHVAPRAYEKDELDRFARAIRRKLELVGG